jgi:hypothetical protein
VCRDKIHSILMVALGTLCPCPGLVKAVLSSDGHGRRGILDVGVLIHLPFVRF